MMITCCVSIWAAAVASTDGDPPAGNDDGDSAAGDVAVEFASADMTSAAETDSLRRAAAICVVDATAAARSATAAADSAAAAASAGDAAVPSFDSVRVLVLGSIRVMEPTVVGVATASSEPTIVAVAVAVAVDLAVAVAVAGSTASPGLTRPLGLT